MAPDLRTRRLSRRATGRPRRWSPGERGRRRRLSRAALISLLLHAIVVAALLIVVHPRTPQEVVPPAPIAMVFEHGGAPRATAPRAVRRGPVETEVLPAPKLPPPPPAAPPAPPEAAPGVAVHLPSESQLQAFLAPPPVPVAPPVPRPPARRPVERAAPPPPHTLFAPSLSFGTRPRSAPAARGLDLALSRSELQRAFAPAFAVEGKIGPDWLALLTRWVDQRKYYPYSAAEMGQQGTVELRLVIERNGRVATASILESSGSPFLDQAWLGMFRGATVPAFPASTDTGQIIIRATMHYILVE